MNNLFQRNFDIDGSDPIEPRHVTDSIAELKAQVETARQEGFDAGRSVGRKEAEAEFATSEAEQVLQERRAIQAKIAELAATDAKAQLATERDIVELFSGIAERLVPELLDTYGVQLATARIRQSLQQSRTDPILAIRACPNVIKALEKETADWTTAAADPAGIDLVPDQSLNPGAAEVTWKGGRLEYDLHGACLEMLKALAKAAETYEENALKV